MAESPEACGAFNEKVECLSNGDSLVLDREQRKGKGTINYMTSKPSQRP